MGWVFLHGFQPAYTGCNYQCLAKHTLKKFEMNKPAQPERNAYEIELNKENHNEQHVPRYTLAESDQR